MVLQGKLEASTVSTPSSKPNRPCAASAHLGQARSPGQPIGPALALRDPHLEPLHPVGPQLWVVHEGHQADRIAGLAQVLCLRDAQQLCTTRLAQRRVKKADAHPDLPIERLILSMLRRSRWRAWLDSEGAASVRVLVVGASGFIGRALVDRLLAEGCTVDAWDRRGGPARHLPAMRRGRPAGRRSASCTRRDARGRWRFISPRTRCRA